MDEVIRPDYKTLFAWFTMHEWMILDTQGNHKEGTWHCTALAPSGRVLLFEGVCNEHRDEVTGWLADDAAMMSRVVDAIANTGPI